MANTSPTMTSDERKQAAEYRRLRAEMKSGSLDRFYAGMMSTSFTKFLVKASLIIQQNTKTFFSKFGGALNVYFRKVFGDVIDTFQPLITMFSASIELLWNVLKPLGKFAISLVMFAPKKIIGIIWDGISHLYQTAFDLLKKTGRAIFIRPIKGVLNFIGEMILSVWSYIITPIKKTASIMFRYISYVAKQIVKNTIDFVAWGIGKVLSAPGAIMGWFIKKVTPSWFGSIAAPIVSTLITGTLFTLLMKGAFSVGKGVFDTITGAIGTFFESAVKTIKGYFTDAWDWFERNFPETAKYIEDIVKWVKIQTINVYNMVTGVIEGMIPFAKSLLTSFGIIFSSLASQLPKYVIDGIKAAMADSALEVSERQLEKEKEKLDEAWKRQDNAGTAATTGSSLYGDSYKKDWESRKKEYEKQKKVVDNLEKQVEEQKKLAASSKNIMGALQNAFKTNLPITSGLFSGDTGVIDKRTEIAGTGSHMQLDSLGIGSNSFLTELSQGTGKYIRWNRGVERAKNLDPEFGIKLLAMAQEYHASEKEKLNVISSWRSFDEQARLKKKYGRYAADPGKSKHNFGRAADIEVRQLNRLKELGLLKKYGFEQNLLASMGAREAHHIEMIGGSSKVIDKNTEAIMANTDERDKANKKDSPFNTILSALGGAFSTLIDSAGKLTADDLFSLGKSSSNVPGALAVLNGEKQETANDRARRIAENVGNVSLQHFNLLFGNTQQQKYIKTNESLLPVMVDSQNFTG